MYIVSLKVNSLENNYQVVPRSDSYWTIIKLYIDTTYQMKWYFVTLTMSCI